VLLLKVEGTDKITGAISKGTLTLCDLAGSERISKTEAEKIINIYG
jgi:kinesin family protein C2/C3